MKRTLAFLMILSSLNIALADDVIVARVITVIDGNTLEVLSDDNETRKIILAGIDTPELTQEYGEKAKKFLEKLILERNVTVTLQGKDRHGNLLGIVMTEDKDKIDPRLELLKEGLAWTAERNPLPELEEVRTKAQQKGKGLWKQDEPTPPWIYRRQQSMLQPKGSG